MLYKEIVCPVCKGRGFISGGDDHSMWSNTCDYCHGYQFIAVLKTNGDIIRTCNDEQLTRVYHNLQSNVIYSSGYKNRLLDDSQEDFLLWLNKEADDIDIKTIFDFIDEKNYEHPYLKTVNI